MSAPQTRFETNPVCFICRRLIDASATREIGGETFCDVDGESVKQFGLIGAACKRQMELAIHAMSHRDLPINGLYVELTELFERYGLIDRADRE